MTIVPVGAELFKQTDGRDEASGHFSQFCESACKVFSVVIENLMCESSKDLENKHLGNEASGTCE
jgi:hypothetical protein